MALIFKHQLHDKVKNHDVGQACSNHEEGEKRIKFAEAQLEGKS